MSPLISSSSQKLTTFFAHRFIAFYCFHSGVTPLRVSPPHHFLPVRPRFSTILCKFAHNNFFLRVSPPWRVSPGAVRPHSDATANNTLMLQCVVSSKTFFTQENSHNHYSARYSSANTIPLRFLPPGHYSPIWYISLWVDTFAFMFVYFAYTKGSMQEPDTFHFYCFEKNAVCHIIVTWWRGIEA